MEPRIVETLGDAEHDAVWLYNDPIWPAHYAWHPDEGWMYCTRSMPAWRPAVAGTGTVDTGNITHGACGEKYDFVEVARFGGTGSVTIFTSRGSVEVPTGISFRLADGQPSKHG